ncbi:hypothetical protein [Winogradskya consettensis]|nr:hypothetical protein [Actinoplanes consettensis]
MALLRAALAGTTGGTVAFYVCGPGGIGKSALLRRVAHEAGSLGRPVVRRDIADLESRVVPAGTGPAVILIDDCDHVDRLPEILPRTGPPGTVFIVASRRPPAPRWTGALRVVALAPLSAAQSQELIRELGVPRDRWATVLSVGRGNPLALRVAARVAAAGTEFLRDDDLRREVAVSLFHRLIGDIPSGAHRQALEVCAVASGTTEDLLRATVPAGGPGELFAWLRDRPFVASRARGLFPSAAVREVVRAELHWRDPEALSRYRTAMVAFA